jgi:hypothetical protein
MTSPHFLEEIFGRRPKERGFEPPALVTKRSLNSRDQRGAACGAKKARECHSNLAHPLQCLISHTNRRLNLCYGGHLDKRTGLLFISHASNKSIIHYSCSRQKRDIPKQGIVDRLQAKKYIEKNHQICNYALFI